MDQRTTKLIQLGLRQRNREEDQLCEQIADELRGLGHRVEREYNTKHGRVDIAILHPTEPAPVEFIEAKLYQPLSGIGQLLAYGLAIEAGRRPALTLVVPAAMRNQPGLTEVCNATGIKLWVYRSSDQQRLHAAFYSPERQAARQQQQASALAANKRAREQLEWERMLRAIQKAQAKARRNAQ